LPGFQPATANHSSVAGRWRQMKIISPAVSGTGFTRRAELFFLIAVSSPSRRPIRKKKPPSVASVSLTSAVSGWLGNRSNAHVPFPRECKQYLAPGNKNERVCKSRLER
jgi:hypothetical protein